jgi:ABC-type sugar transport system ATPase subunit
MCSKKCATAKTGNVKSTGKGAKQKSICIEKHFAAVACTFGHMQFLEVNGVGRRQNEQWIVQEVSFTQQPLQKIAIAGETGSGKSTLLKMIGGLVQPHTGSIRLLDERVEGPEEKLIPGHSGIAYLSQQFELPKFLRVEQVLAYANKLTGTEAQALYEICRITHLMQRRTDQLSGGEQQRIALARLLSGRPKLLLLDEPFSNLDRIHTNILKTVLKEAEEQLQLSFIHISHDPLDTLPWADEILVMKAGKLVQQGTPEQVYHQPANEYVAGLFGPYQLLSPALYEALLPTTSRQTDSGNIPLLRPEKIHLSDNGIGLAAQVMDILFVGNGYELILQVMDEQITVWMNAMLPEKGSTVYVSVRNEEVWFV